MTKYYLYLYGDEKGEYGKFDEFTPEFRDKSITGIISAARKYLHSLTKEELPPVNLPKDGGILISTSSENISVFLDGVLQ